MSAPPNNDVLTLTACDVDMVRAKVNRAGEITNLSALEVKVLRLMASRPGETIGREELLRKVWGFENAVTTRSVDNTVSRLRSKIERRPSDPDHVMTVHGEGYRFVYDPPSFAQVVQAEASSPELPSHTPAIDGFIGREGLLEDLTREFERGARIISLLGPGGVGKTRLATHWVKSQETAASHVVFCDLAASWNLDDIQREIASRLNVPLTSQDIANTTQQLGRALAARGPTCLLLDNAEQAIAATRDLLNEWVALAPHLTFLITSRIALHLPGERRLEVNPLPAAQGIELFHSQALIARGRALPASEAHAVTALVKRLDGLPLAIKLAASRSAVLAPSAILAYLDQQEALPRPRSADTSRQSTLESTVLWSWQLLSPRQQTFLGRLSLFRGGASLAASLAICQESASHSAIDLLTELVDHCMIHVMEVGGKVRYGMYEVIRLFTRQRLDAHSERDARLAHASWCRTQAVQLAQAIEGSEPQRAADGFAAEAGNILAAATWASTHEPTLAREIVLCARWLAITQGPLAAWLDITNRLVDAQTAGQAQSARLQLLQGELLHLSGHAADAIAAFEMAINIGESQGDEATCLDAMSRYASFQFLGGNIESATAQLRTAAQRARASRLPRQEGLARDRLGTLLHVTGNVKEARREMAKAQRAFQRASSLAAASQTRANLALMDLELGKTQRASEHLRAAIELNRSMGNRRNEALLWINLAGVAQEEGDLATAKAHLDEALDVSRSFGLERSLGLALTALALVEAQTRDILSAREHILSAQMTLNSLGEPLFEGLAWAYLGAIDALDGAVEEAEESFSEARSLLSGSGATTRLAIVDVLEALLDLSQAKDSVPPERQRLMAAATTKIQAVSTPTADAAPLTSSSSQVRAAVRLVDRQLKELEPVFEEHQNPAERD